MLACSLVAVCGAICTYTLIPQYGVEQLQDEDTYIELEHDCVKPDAEMREFMQAVRQARQFEMVQIVDYQSCVGESDWDMSEQDRPEQEDRQDRQDRQEQGEGLSF
jgi:hypothetical protein